MKQFGKLSAFLTLTFLSYRVAGAPIPPTAATNLENTSLPSIDQSGTSGLKSNNILPPSYRRRRTLSEIADPVIAESGPLVKGVGHGITAGGGNVGSAEQYAGEAVDKAAAGAKSIAANAAAGLGETIAQVPKGTYGTIHNLEHGGVGESAVDILLGDD